MIGDFRELVKHQIKLYPEQEKTMKEHRDYIINNLDGIKNQKDEDYKVDCSMEGHINQAFCQIYYFFSLWILRKRTRK